MGLRGDRTIGMFNTLGKALYGVKWNTLEELASLRREGHVM